MPVLSDRQIAALAIGAGFPADQVPTAVAVALAESGGDTDAANTSNRNGSRDDGLMQINSIHGISPAELRDPAKNMAAAFRIWTAAGRKWTPWSVYKNGRYRVHLPRGTIAARSPDSSGIPAGGGGSGAAAPAGNPFESIINPGVWFRIGLFIFGAFLLVVALAKLTGIGSTVVEVATTAIPITRGLK